MPVRCFIFHHTSTRQVISMHRLLTDTVRLFRGQIQGRSVTIIYTHMGHNPTMSCYANTAISPTLISMFVRRSRTEHASIIEFSHLLVRAGSVLCGIWKRDWGGLGELSQHMSIVPAITMDYMIRRSGLFVNTISHSISTLCSNNMKTICAWTLMVWVNFKPLRFQNVRYCGECLTVKYFNKYTIAFALMF
jgi:hypothetical protein